MATIKSIDIPDCHYPKEPTLVPPISSTPRHCLYLSNLDDQKFLRFSIKYLYVFHRAVAVEALKASLSRALVEYYPLAGRLRACGGEGEKLEVDCNGEGALLAEACVGLTAREFLEGSARPNKSWRKLLYRVEAQSFVGVPPLVVQVTHLSCGGMILCIAISHCLCDGIGTAQFLHAWSQLTAKPSSDVPTAPFHGRHMLKPRNPPRIAFSHPEFNDHEPSFPNLLLIQSLLSQPLTPVSLTFTASHILRLKKQCLSSLKCTSFEVLAARVWRAWATSLDLPAALRVKLLFSINVRRRLKPGLEQGFYGNGFVLGCAEAAACRLAAADLPYGVKLVQEAKECIDDEYVRSMIDLLEEKRAMPDLSASLVISAWTRLGLEDLDFGEGRPLHMGPLTSEIYCVFSPVAGDRRATTVLISVPKAIAGRFQECCLQGLNDGEDNGGDGLDVV